MTAHYCIYLLNKFFLLINYQLLGEIMTQQEYLYLYTFVVFGEFLCLPLLMFGLHPRGSVYIDQQYHMMCLSGTALLFFSSIFQYDFIIYNKVIVELIPAILFLIIVEARILYNIIR